MTSWGELARREPEFMEAVTVRFDAHLHKFLATVRKDGSPRLSGIETSVRHGDLWLAGMPNGRKFQDLRRDPRFALHSGSDDADPTNPAEWIGDAKLSGVATEVTDPAELARYAGETEHMPPGEFELFRVDIRDAVLVRMGDPADHIVVTHWHPDRGLTHTKRS